MNPKIKSIVGMGWFLMLWAGVVAANPTASERSYWRAMKENGSKAAIQSYVSRYPQGVYLEEAQQILSGTAPVQQVLQPANQPANQTVTQSSTSFTTTAPKLAGCEGCFVMVKIPAGRFSMGSEDGAANEKPVRSVNVSVFEMGQTEVTQREWQWVMGTNPSRFKGEGKDNHPVEQISWQEAQAFVVQLNAKTRLRYRLPTEAEWEYAARAGSDSRHGWGNDSSSAPLHAWFDDNSRNSTQAVKQKRANAFGLYDVLGNVSEWVEDSLNGKRVNRGGSWYEPASDLRPSIRYANPEEARYKTVGLRLVKGS